MVKMVMIMLLTPPPPPIIIIIIIIIIMTIPADKCCTKGSGKEVKIQAFTYRDTTIAEPEMYDCTGNNWSHWNSNEKLKEKNWKLYQENIR